MIQFCTGAFEKHLGIVIVPVIVIENCDSNVSKRLFPYKSAA
jgi:hypothetical protein